MPRLRRVVVPGLPHHITQRGNRRCNAFSDEQDRKVFLRIMGEASRRHSLRHYSYCLMSNHIHLISIPESEFSLALTMRDLLGPYAIYFNSKYAFKGHLWQGRYRSSPLDDERFWVALRYVERNPVRSGMVARAEDYRWSSAAAHCGLIKDRLLTPLTVIPEFYQDWSEWLRGEEREEELKAIRHRFSSGRPVGSERFLQGLEKRLGRRLRLLPGGRPRKKADQVNSQPG